MVARIGELPREQFVSAAPLIELQTGPVVSRRSRATQGGSGAGSGRPMALRDQWADCDIG